MFIEIDHKKIYFEFVNEQFLQSNNSLIIFLHEGLGCTEQWFDFPARLTDSLQIAGFLYDRYGFGKSAESAENKNPNYLEIEADFLHKMINKLFPEKEIILFAHSDGATIALMYASKYHQHLKTVISIAHHVVIEQKTIEGVKKAIEAYKNGKLRNSLLKFHGTKTDKMFQGWSDSTVYNYDFDMSDKLKKIRVPVFAIQGDNDQYGSKLQLELIEKNVKKSKTLLVENCDHYPQRKYPELLIESIKNFIKV